MLPTSGDHLEPMPLGSFRGDAAKMVQGCGRLHYAPAGAGPSAMAYATFTLDRRRRGNDEVSNQGFEVSLDMTIEDAPHAD